MKKHIFGLLTLACSLLASPLMAQVPLDVVTVHDSGDPALLIDLVILGDGYTIDEQNLFTQNAQTLIDFMFTIDAFGNYENFLNIHLVYLESNESGADRPNDNYYVDTALDATHGTSVPRLITVNRSKAQFAASYAPDVDQMLVIVNDSNYGGSGSPGLAVTYNGSLMVNVGVHEYGHSFGSLADEYGGGTCYTGTEPSEANVTVATTINTIKWAIWIEPGTPITHLDSNGNSVPGSPSGTPGVGLFEGGRYYDQCIYRPKENCEMRALQQGFCPVCKEQLVKRAYDYVELIEGQTPESSSVTVSQNDRSVTFSVIVREPQSGVDYQWYLDGEAIEGATDSSYQLNVTRMDTGNYEVSVNVHDSTDLVRKDESNLLQSSVTWRVEVTNSGSPCGMILPGSGSTIVFGLLLLFLYIKLTVPLVWEKLFIKSFSHALFKNFYI